MEVVDSDGGAQSYYKVDETKNVFTIGTDEAEYVLMDTNGVSDGEPRYNDKTVVSAFPFANIFADRSNGRIQKKGSFGKVQPYGGHFSSNDDERGVVWIVTQRYPGNNAKGWESDALEKRCDALRKALGCMLSWPTPPKSLAIARMGVSCTHQPEQWAAFATILKQWSSQYKIPITVTKPIYEKKADGTVVESRYYNKVSSPTALPGQDVFVKQLLACAPKPKIVPPPLPFMGGMGMQKPTVAPPPPPKFACPIAFDASGNAVGDATVMAANQAKAAAEAPPPPVDDDPYQFTKRPIVPPTPLWTASSWFKTKVTDVMTPRRILELRRLTQGSQPWLDAKRETIMISSTDFINCSTEFRGESSYSSETKMLKKKLWWTKFGSNSFMKWGNDHEDNGIGMVTQLVELGHLTDAVWEPRDDKKGYKFMSFHNHAIETEWVDKTLDGSRPYNVFQKEDEHGINVHVGNKVMSTSYDGLFWVVDNTTHVGRYVYVEIKCPVSMYDAVKPAHYCQVLGSMGILRAQGIMVEECLYGVWTPDLTNMWRIPFDEVKYKRLENDVLNVFAKKLLPRLVARDNGLLVRGELELGATPEGAARILRSKKKRKPSDDSVV